MSIRVIDLRSDTVTRPTPPMREAMARAEVGDDVFGDDPTVCALEARFASITGKEAALFVPSGTMANQLALRSQTEPGDEVIAHPECHIVFYETGAPAALSGVTIRFAEGERGVFNADTLRALARGEDSHFPPTRMVTMENTHNRGGGRVWPLRELHETCLAARELRLRVHIDGARIWNASVASGVAVREIVRHADTVSACFSKGLGAPVGSALAGDARTIARARRFRKMFGGGMRQAGVLAGAAIYALDHHVERLRDDHASARSLAERLAGVPGVRIDPREVETNLVYFTLDPSLGGAEHACEAFERAGVRVLPEGRQTVRAVTHLDVSRADIDEAGERMARVLSAARG